MFEVGKKYNGTFTQGAMKCVYTCLWADETHAVISWVNSSGNVQKSLYHHCDHRDFREYKEPRSIKPRFFGVYGEFGGLHLTDQSFSTEEGVRQWYKDWKIIDVIKIEYTEKL